MEPPPPQIALTYDSRPHRPFSRWRRGFAFAIDVAIFAPIVLMLCVAGSFDTETTHRHFSWLFVIAPLVYPLTEIVLTRTPGVWLLGGRFIDRDGAPPRYLQMLSRALWKWGAFVFFVPLFIVTGETIGEKPAGFIILPLLVLSVVAVYLFFLSRGRGDSSAGDGMMWFDRFAGTRLVRKPLRA